MADRSGDEQSAPSNVSIGPELQRIMVDLPDIDNREQILRVLLRKETLEPDFDFREVCSLCPAFARRCARLAGLAVSGGTY
jgi:ATP-dependent 26S proteasome regulatory subunit